jgi:chromosome segregation ATPase
MSRAARLALRGLGVPMTADQPRDQRELAEKWCRRFDTYGPNGLMPGSAGGDDALTLARAYLAALAELDEARASVDHLVNELADARRERDEARNEVASCTISCGVAVRQSERHEKERDEAVAQTAALAEALRVAEENLRGDVFLEATDSISAAQLANAVVQTADGIRDALANLPEAVS